MPDLLVPFRGERYRATARLSALIAPPYDVLSPAERARLAARDPENIVHLTLPEAGYQQAAALLADWRRRGVLVRDPEPAVYVVAQEFTLPGGARRTRVGLFAALRAEPYEAGRVKPHERTHAAPKADRLALLRATETNLESIFVLAPDPDGALAGALAEVTRRPPAARAELDGVGIRLWIVTGAEGGRLAAFGSRHPVYIADGHHRYETAVAYARERPEADRLLAFVVSVRDPGLAVLATHRVIHGAGRDPAPLVDLWRRWFDVGRVAPCADRVERLAELGRDRTACIVAWPGDYDLSLVLKADAPLSDLPEIGRSAAVRALDVARIEALVVQAIVRSGTATPTVTYTHDPYAAFDAVRKGGAAAAVLMNPPRVEQVLAVADAGDVMPPKSTYFVPKVPGGLVLRPVS
ncbi:MAG TPA: DUF1015 domain-containing protein [Gemmatimonadales bacterium]|nr:DUF1015 domain-containing protein [Gemmatimonadales bacterium]